MWEERGLCFSSFVPTFLQHCCLEHAFHHLLVPVWCVYVIDADMWTVSQWPTDPLSSDTSSRTSPGKRAIRVSCVQWRWGNHHKTWLCTKNHVRMLEKASQKPRGTLWVWPDHRDYCSALPGLLHPNNWRLQLVKAPLRKLGASQPPPARCKLPSAFVSVPPSSSHTGASCSRVRRRDNRNMGQSWWASILKAALGVAPG